MRVFLLFLWDKLRKHQVAFTCILPRCFCRHKCYIDLQNVQVLWESIYFDSWFDRSIAIDENSEL